MIKSLFITGSSNVKLDDGLSLNLVINKIQYLSDNVEKIYENVLPRNKCEKIGQMFFDNNLSQVIKIECGEKATLGDSFNYFIDYLLENKVFILFIEEEGVISTNHKYLLDNYPPDLVSIINVVNKDTCEARTSTISKTPPRKKIK